MNFYDVPETELYNKSTDVALLISNEFLFSDLQCEDLDSDTTLYSRRMFFWSKPESEEDLIVDCIYEKYPEIKVKYYSPVLNKYDIAFLAVINAGRENMESDQLWDTIPLGLCKKIADLLNYSGDLIAEKSFRENEMILWSHLKPV